MINMLCEGIGIRAVSRLTGLDKKTVLRILESAGEHCAGFLESKVCNVKAAAVEVDEIFCFVGCKQRRNLTNDCDKGDQYLFMAIDADTKLIVNHIIGKRDAGNALALMEDLKRKTNGHFQLTTDAFQPYKNVVRHTFGNEIDFAQLLKIYAAPNQDLKGERRYSPPECVSTRVIVRSGNPDRNRVSTSYIERTNLSVRLFNRRFTRLTLGYSKKIENLRFSTALFIAHFNFCRIHSAHKKTPAMAAGLTDHVWTIEELLGFVSRNDAEQKTGSAI
ncbi:MAG: DDE-type integrase/transposase/recombinase [Limisphaerales bacterium]